MSPSPAAQIAASPGTKLSTFALLKKSKVITVGAVIVLTCLLCAGSIQVYLSVMDAHIRQLIPKPVASKTSPNSNATKPANSEESTINSEASAASDPTPVHPSKPVVKKRLRRVRIVRKKVAVKNPSESPLQANPTNLQIISPSSREEVEEPESESVVVNDSKNVPLVHVNHPLPVQVESEAETNDDEDEETLKSDHEPVTDNSATSQVAKLSKPPRNNPVSKPILIPNRPKVTEITEPEKMPIGKKIPSGFKMTNFSGWSSNVIGNFKSLFNAQERAEEEEEEVEEDSSDSIEAAIDDKVIKENSDVLIIKNSHENVAEQAVRGLKKLKFHGLRSETIMRCLLDIFNFAVSAIPAQTVSLAVFTLLKDNIKRLQETLVMKMMENDKMVFLEVEPIEHSRQPFSIVIREALDFWNERFIPALLLDPSFRVWHQSLSKQSDKEASTSRRYLSPIEWMNTKAGPISTTDLEDVPAEFFDAIVNEIDHVERTFTENLRNIIKAKSRTFRLQPFNQQEITISGRARDKYIISYYNDLLARLGSSGSK